MFIRKIAPEFPNTLLREYIYEKSKEADDKLMVVMPPLFMILKIKKYLYFSLYYAVPLLFLLYVFKYIF
jgi:hypothetical protein